jgi:alpha-glucosidase
MLGENVLVAPILTTGGSQRAVYLPQGRWFNYWTDEVYEGGRYILVEADLETLPIFIKAGSFLPEGEIRQSTSVPEETLTIHVYLSDEAFGYTLYEDDGETFDYLDGKTFAKRFFCYSDGKKIKLNTEETGDFKPSWERTRVVLHGMKSISEIWMNGTEINHAHIKRHQHNHTAEWTL